MRLKYILTWLAILPTSFTTANAYEGVGVNGGVQAVTAYIDTGVQLKARFISP